MFFKSKKRFSIEGFSTNMNELILFSFDINTNNSEYLIFKNVHYMELPTIMDGISINWMNKETYSKKGKGIIDFDFLGVNLKGFKIISSDHHTYYVICSFLLHYNAPMRVLSSNLDSTYLMNRYPSEHIQRH